MKRIKLFSLINIVVQFLILVYSIIKGWNIGYFTGFVGIIVFSCSYVISELFQEQSKEKDINLADPQIDVRKSYELLSDRLDRIELALALRKPDKN